MYEQFILLSFNQEISSMTLATLFAAKHNHRLHFLNQIKATEKKYVALSLCLLPKVRSKPEEPVLLQYMP